MRAVLHRRAVRWATPGVFAAAIATHPARAAAAPPAAAPAQEALNRVRGLLGRCGPIGECCPDPGTVICKMRQLPECSPEEMAKLPACVAEVRVLPAALQKAADHLLDVAGDPEWSRLVRLLDLAGALDPPRLARIARHGVGQSSTLDDEFLTNKVTPHQPARNGWLLDAVEMEPASSSDVRSQWYLLGHAVEVRGLPSSVLPLVAARYPKFLGEHDVRGDHPEIVGLLVDRLNACTTVAEVAGVARMLAKQLETHPSIAAALAGVVDPLRRARVVAYAAALSPVHGAAFVRELGQPYGWTLFDSLDESVRLDPAAIDPEDAGLSEGLRRLFSLPPSGPVSIDLETLLPAARRRVASTRARTDARSEAQRAARSQRWVTWLLGEREHGRIPLVDGGPGGAFDTNSLSSFDFLVANDRDLTTHFHELDPQSDGLRARLIRAWCAQDPGGVDRVPLADVSAVAGYGRDALDAALYCAWSQGGDARWARWVTALAGALSPATLEDASVFAQLCATAAAWDEGSRARLIDVVARRGPVGALLSELIRFSSAFRVEDGPARVASLLRAFEATGPAEAALRGAGPDAPQKVADLFRAAGHVVRSGLDGGGRPPFAGWCSRATEASDAVSRDAEEASRRAAVPVRARAWFEAARDAVLPPPRPCPTL